MGVAVLSPLLTLAAFDPGAEPVPLTGVNTVIGKITGVIWPIFMGLALIMLIVAGFLFLTSNGEPDKLKTARAALIWSVVGIIVGILAYSIPGVVKTLLNP